MIKKLLNNKKLFFTFSILWTIFIFIACSIPGKDLPKIHLFTNFDKVVHFIFFFVFTALWFITLLNGKVSYLIIFLKLVFVSLIFGFGIEFWQKYFIVGRSFDVLDGLTDFLGSLFFFIFAKPIFMFMGSNNLTEKIF